MAQDDDRRGKVQTVRGLMDPAALGPTLMHEHILWDVTRPEVRARAEAAGTLPISITLENVWEINRRSILDYGNQRNDDLAVALKELIRLRESGGAAVVDLSNFGLNPDPAGLRHLSQGAEVTIIQGAGYYVDEYIPAAVKRRSVDQLTREIVAQVTEGCWGTDVRAGIIGEIGCMWPLRPFERKVLRAATVAQRETGASINVHPGRHRQAPFDIVDIIVAAGGDPTRLVMSHIDRTLFSDDEVLRLADTGCVIEYDFFGIESAYYPFQDIDLPNDATRLAAIRALIDRGHLAQVLISQDICTKTRLTRYGGHGYGHVFDNVVPMMERKGFEAAEIRTILEDTPRRLLTFQ